MIRRSLAWLTCYALSVGAFVLLTGCANLPLEDRAKGAAIADSVSTVGALMIPGVIELSPLRLLTIPAKFLALAYCKTLPEDEQVQCHASASALWGGAAVNNVLVAATALADIACGPWCIVAGIGYGAYAWNESAPEREFHAACQAYKQWSGETLPCVFKLAKAE